MQALSRISAVSNPADDFEDLVVLMEDEPANAVRVVLPQLWPDQQHTTFRVYLQSSSLHLLLVWCFAMFLGLTVFETP